MTDPAIHAHVAPTPAIVEAARAGRMVILADDEDRENEGDLVIPAQFATAEAIAFMARHARGLVCLAMTGARVAHLGLKPMALANGTRHQTAFTVSIEAREGVTTGISAHDRARTVAAAVNPEAVAADLVSPGHVFPLAARAGGVLERAGHTEAAVDIARLAGLNPAAVICEIMNDDGTMARMPELIAFAERFDLKLGTIADLIAHRRRTESLVQRVRETPLEAVGGTWWAHAYAGPGGRDYLALVHGDLDGGAPLVRMHAADPLEAVLADGLGRLHAAMRQIARRGAGVVVVIPPQEGFAARLARDDAPTVGDALRDYGPGAQILADLGVRRMILLSNHPRAVVGLEGHGLSLLRTEPIEDSP